ncbi:MAG: DUF6607 family protein [Planctomycetota bacterium]
MLSLPLRPLLAAAGFLALLLTLLLTVGCSSTGSTTQVAAERECCGQCAGDTTLASANDAKFEQDRAAILAMAGEYKVTFAFQEVLGVRAGYELADPYTSAATELVEVVEDNGDFISLQHLLVVTTEEGEHHVVKHWRQDWRYEQAEGYSFAGNNVWQPIDFDAIAGTWTQSVYQVDDSPRYWGVGTWVHRDGVSTWSSSLTNRPLPRREYSKRSDYQVLAAINTHVVTPNGWMHYQSNYKHDLENPESPVIALESGVNTYERTTEADFSAAREYWENTEVYWAEVRAAWSDIYAGHETLALQSRVRGEPMYSHFFDMADEYWGDADCADVRERAQAIIDEFRRTEAASVQP